MEKTCRVMVVEDRWVWYGSCVFEDKKKWSEVAFNVSVVGIILLHIYVTYINICKKCHHLTFTFHWEKIQQKSFFMIKIPLQQC